MAKYENVVDDHRVIARYIHQCNSNTPTGELAFKRLLDNGPWAKYPMGDRMKENFSKHIPVTFVYGDKTWMKTEYGDIIKNARSESYTRVEFVKDAGHHVYADNPEEFNSYVLEACEILKSQQKDEEQ
jgi:abhydrolase domain-containing protein 5